MKKISQLKHKKGFTLVEIIVVLAIIGVLTAMIAPSLMADKRPDAGKSYSKDYFYKLQGYLSSEKLSGSTAITDETIVYIDLGKEKKLDAVSGNYVMFTIDDCGIAKQGVSTRDAASSFAAGTELREFFDGMVRKLNTSLEQPEFEGSLYAVVDAQYRVQASYWTNGDWASEVDGGVFTDNCQLTKGNNITICSAFPTILCTPTGKGKTVDTLKIFDYSNVI